MIALIGIFVITSSACVGNPILTSGTISGVSYGSIPVFNLIKTNYDCYEKFIRVSSSAIAANNEIARPICDWIDHDFRETIGSKREDSHLKIYEYKYCIYCDKKRIKREVWEDVK